MFGDSEVKKELKELRSELSSLRTELRTKSKDLEQQIQAKTSDYEASAKQSSKKASEYRNRSLERKNEIEQALDTINEQLDKAKNLSNEIQKAQTESSELNSLISGFYNEASDIGANFEEIKSNMSDQLEAIENTSEQISISESKLEQTTTLMMDAETANRQISAMLQQSLKSRNRIKELYDEILGSEIRTGGDDSEETVEYIPGLKDELEETYEALKNKLTEFSDAQDSTLENITQDFQSELEKLTNSFDKLLSQSKESYVATSEELKRLLPNALTAGLSHAYSDKKEQEERTFANLSKTFKKTIYSLCALSVIPIGVNLYRLVITDTSLTQVLTETPSVLAGIMPIYFPMLWLAYSTNKKLNLSKRLIEEYTHKEVLSRTYEGLSKQVDSIDDESTKEVLSTKLLSNILEVSSENPGKLISDYNKSDHPFVDALEAGHKLTNSIEKLENMPGFRSIAKRVSSRNEKKLKAAEDNFEQALAANEAETTKEPA